MNANNDAMIIQINKPDTALKRLDILVGKWTMKGRTFSAQDDNMSGELLAEWMPGGFFQRQTG